MLKSAKDLTWCGGLEVFQMLICFFNVNEKVYKKFVNLEQAMNQQFYLKHWIVKEFAEKTIKKIQCNK